MALRRVYQVNPVSSRFGGLGEPSTVTGMHPDVYSVNPLSGQQDYDPWTPQPVSYPSVHIPKGVQPILVDWSKRQVKDYAQASSGGRSIIDRSYYAPVSVQGSALEAMQRKLNRSGGNSYNEEAFDGPYLRTRYDMGGVAESRTYGVDYPYDMDRYPSLSTSRLSASQWFSAAMANNVLFDRDELQTNNLRLSSAPSVSIAFGSSSGSTGAGRYMGRGFGFSF